MSHPAGQVGQGDITSVPASMNHVAFNVPLEKVDEYRRNLGEAGVNPTAVLNHDDSEAGTSMKITDTTFIRSIYFKDPDGVLLEFAAWTRQLGASDVNLEPVSVRSPADRGINMSFLCVIAGLTVEQEQIQTRGEFSRAESRLHARGSV